MNIEYTCIKEKAKGVYKNTSSSVATEEKPEETTISSVDFETDNLDLENLKEQFDEEIELAAQEGITISYWDLIEISEDEKTFSSEEIEKIKIYFDYPLDRNDDEEDHSSEHLDFEIKEHQEDSYFTKISKSEINFDSIDVSEGFLLRSPADFAPEWEVISNRNNIILVRAENNYYLLEQKKDRLVHRKQLDFDSIVHQVKTDIAKQVFFEKIEYYLDLLKVSREEFDDYLICEFSLEEMKEMIDTGEDEPLWETEVKVNELKVFDRLFALYCPDTGFVIPSNPHVKEWRDRLEKDGRYFPKKQLSIFGEEK
jgi:hypothetical protein